MKIILDIPGNVALMQFCNQTEGTLMHIYEQTLFQEVTQPIMRCHMFLPILPALYKNFRKFIN